MPYCTVQYSYEYEYRVRAPHGSVTSVLTLRAYLKPSPAQAQLKPSRSFHRSGSETYKETTKGKFHHITVQYPVLVRVLFSNVYSYGTVLMSTVWVLVSVQ